MTLPKLKKKKTPKNSNMTFELQYTDPRSNARAGLITTDHGQIETPIFMPVGTLGTVKGVHLHELKDDIKAQIILGNTYHLYFTSGTGHHRRSRRTAQVQRL